MRQSWSTYTKELPGYFAGGLYGEPWSLTLQWSAGNYVNLNIAAPLLGDCRIGYSTRQWRQVEIRHHMGGRRWTWQRETWGAIRQREAASREIDRRVTEAVRRKFSDDQTELLTGNPTPGQIAFGLRREGDG